MGLMSKVKLGTATAIGLIGAMVASQAHAQSASSNDAEIVALKQQLRLMEQKLDKLQRQTAANTTAAASANAKADAKVNVANELGVTPLLLACENGSGDLVTMLLAAGANPNAAPELLMFVIPTKRPTTEISVPCGTLAATRLLVTRSSTNTTRATITNTTRGAFSLV